ncbi:hypothetical protein [Ruminococcus sp.]|jgi:hypothetical protein|uniref:hypothetical protein n=1 Tax=Ruminococcus sp. TaxID=41978 RepID=UPI0029304F37|nr:hypothetical protein [uncultured Ruminococcus sp.]MEE1049251.1 hypothetical protein [Clostridia bacterium]MEE1171819.1 hypothetical protein [Ruminococcus sp.]MEE1355972.1 hypothetical protein [Clostridia bacterium]
MIVSLQKFKQKYGLLDEACRQWCAVAVSDKSRMDGVGFGEFYEKLSLEKYKEYRQHPDRFDVTEQGSTTVLPLTVEELRELEELVANTLCGYTDKSVEDVLLGLEIKFAAIKGETVSEGMS